MFDEGDAYARHIKTSAYANVLLALACRLTGPRLRKDDRLTSNDEEYASHAHPPRLHRLRALRVSGFIAVDAAAQTTGLKRTILNPDRWSGRRLCHGQCPRGRSRRALWSLATLIPALRRPTSWKARSSSMSTASRQGRLQAGDAFQIPAPFAVHGAKNGPAKTGISAVYVVEKGKPAASPA